VRVAIVDPYYPVVLDGLYRATPGLSRQPYDVQLAAIMALAFGTSDAYSHALGTLGHEAIDIVPNCAPLQRAWARERAHALMGLPWRAAAPAILLGQLRAFRPDVVYVQSVGAFRPVVLRALRRRTRLLAGQIASELPQRSRLASYDLLVTSFPHFLGRLGVPTELVRIGFDERVLERIGRVQPHYDVAFVGQLGGDRHAAGNAVLEEAAREIAIDVWGPGMEHRPQGSPLRRRYHGLAWGIDMYRVLASSRIALNRHVDASEGHANNMRLFEATGVGTLLLTDERVDLEGVFVPGEEVVTYSSASDLADKVRWYLEHDDERAAIAAAGQARTLREHTYAQRMRELAGVLEHRLA
jgi:spore maturation protein CgeB